MERERVKKKGTGIKPGKAVIMTGTSAHPPIYDDPNDMSDAKEYVMQYTGIYCHNVLLSRTGFLQQE